jgi:hypothetical protein
MYDLAPKIDKRPKIFHTLFLPNLSHKRYRTVPYRTILYVTVFKNILSLHFTLHFPLLFTQLHGPSP